MKHNRIYHYFGWLALSTLLLTTACAGISDLDVEKPKVSGPNTVTFTIQPQTMTGGMRAAGDIDTINTRNTVIGKGGQIDVLIFAVYKKDSEGNYKIVERYGKGDQTADEKYATKLQEGQTAIDATIDKYPISLQFVIEDDGDYQVAFWAQNSKTEAYNTADLTKVKVNYQTTETVGGKNQPKNYLNNDELRDAFCAVSEVINANTKDMQTVTLRRPLAQVNVGTTGWDYEGAAVLRPGKISYTESTITLKGVAQYYNVLEKKAEKDTTSVSFDYYRLPAFINVDSSEWDRPQIHPYYEKTNEESMDSIRIEEFLTVDLDKNDSIKSYIGWAAYKGDADSEPQYGELSDTEEFKYLSMCYVLVPEATTTGATDTGSTVDVDFTFRGTDLEESTTSEIKTKEFSKHVKVSNVPVQKNWRTNILSNGFFTHSTNFILDIVPEYMGDFNYSSQEWGDTLSSWPQKKGGETYELTFQSKSVDINTKDFFKCNITDGAEKKGQYGNKSYSYAMKMNGAAVISFTTETSATVHIVQSNAKDDYNRGEAWIQFNGKEYGPDSKNVSTTGCTNARVYTFDVDAGQHKILRTNKPEVVTNDNQAFIFSVIVITKDDIHPNTRDEDEEVQNKWGDDYKK